MYFIQFIQAPFDRKTISPNVIRIENIVSYTSPTENIDTCKFRNTNNITESCRYLYFTFSNAAQVFSSRLIKLYSEYSLSSVFVPYSRWLRRFLSSLSFSVVGFDVLGSFGIFSTHAQTWSLAVWPFVDFSANQDRHKGIQFSLVRSVFGATLKKSAQSPIQRSKITFFNNFLKI